jgi:hypothetical protein
LASPLIFGLYVDDFVSFSEDSAVEALFCWLLLECCKIDFMGIVELFLGVHISWHIAPLSVAVHINQSGFASNLVKSFLCDAYNPTQMVTPYQYCIPINLIAPSLDNNNSLAQV